MDLVRERELMDNMFGGGTDFLIRRRFELLKRKEDEDMKNWELLSTVTLDEPKNVAFELKNINCTEIYIFANVGITESGNTSINVGNVGMFTAISTIGSCKYNTIHLFVVGGRLLMDEVDDYVLQGYPTNKVGIHPKSSIIGDTITKIKLFRNLNTNTFVKGSNFEIWGR